MAKRKAKKLTKTGRKRTGARASTKRTAGRRVKRAKGSTAGATRARKSRPTARRASSVAKPAAARRATQDEDRGAMPLRDLVRGGMPRSPKAHHPPGLNMLTPWSQRRTKTAHGLRSGSTIYQAQQSTRERYGGMKFSVPKRG